jgi:hypothetical protein
MSNRIVTVAARNVRPGDRYINKSDRRREQLVLHVERVDWEDRIEVQITVRDDSTWIPSEQSWTMRLHHTLQVRKGVQERTKMSWEPCYYDTTNRPKPLPKRSKS